MEVVNNRAMHVHMINACVVDIATCTTYVGTGSWLLAT